MPVNTSMVDKRAVIAEAKQNTPAGPDQSRDFNAMLLAVGQHRDRDSFIALFDYFAPRVKSFLMKNGTAEETADELAQETMLAVWDKAAAFDPRQARASTWIFTIARNKKIDMLRKTTRYQFEPADDNINLQDDTAAPVKRSSAPKKSKASPKL